MKIKWNIISRLKISIAFLLLLFFVSCKVSCANPLIKDNAGEVLNIDNLNAVLNTSIYSSNVYIGISPKMRTHEKEIDYAKLHIAHQIAMRDNCIVDIETLRISKGIDDFIIFESDFDYNDAHIDSLMEHIEIINIYRSGELIALVGKDTTKPAYKNKHIPRAAEKRPQWVNNPGWVRGLLGQEYAVGVGLATGTYRQFYKGIFAADVRAAQAIASGEEVSIDTYRFNITKNNDNYYNAGTLSLTENMKLEGFYILDRWIEPDGSQYYSLGIARKRK